MNNTASMHVGIDLGTTNTVIATCKQRNRYLRSTVRDINQYERAKQMGVAKNLPSVLFFDTDGKIKVGRYARFKKEDGADKRILYNTKIDIGKRVSYENDFTPVKAAAEILKVCRDNIKTYIRRDDEFPTVTITVPASFNQNQITDTLKAAELAGFDLTKVSILEEPVAALFHYLNEQQLSGEEETIDFSQTKRVLVYDIGGGTCDVCVVDLKVNAEYDFEVHFIVTNRYTEFGGNDFDEQAAIGLLNKLFKRYKIDEKDIDSDEIKNNLVSSILPFCEQYKLDYSQQLSVNGLDGEIHDAAYGTLSRFMGKYENVELDLPYDEYKKYTESFFANTYLHPTRDYKDKMREKNVIKPIHDLLNRLRALNERGIDCVFLTGGMSKYLPIEEAIRNYCKVPIIKTEVPMDSVALGAALYQFIRTTKEQPSLPERNDIEQQDDKQPIIDFDRPKLAESIFVDIENDLPMKIIDSNTPIPCKGVVDHEFHVSSSGVCINLFAGQSQWDPEMRILYDYSTKFKNIVPPDTGAIISFEIDDNRYLRMVLELKDIRKQQYELTPSDGVGIEQK